MNATILTIGDELLIGQVINTNAAWLGEQLTLLGVDVVRMVTVGDDREALRAEVARVWAASDVVMLTGGLGPTHDDVTGEVVADVFGAPLRTEDAVLGKIQERYRRRGQPMPESNRKLAQVPAGFDVLDNPVGSAPGLWHDDGGRVLVVLPGVPREMKALVQDAVLPRLRERAGLRAIRHRTLRTAGIGESSLQDELGDLSDLLGPDLRLAYLPRSGEVRLRLTATGADPTDAEARLDRLETRLRDRAGDHIYGADDESLEAALGRLLAERGLTLATAESCTGGLVAHRLTNVPGSSAYVRGGVVAYANDVKQHRLGVDAEALERYGAVSEVVARQMARGARLHFGADLGVSTTGIAGPSGGTPEKPVGTVWIGVSSAAGEDAYRFHFGPDRAHNKERAAVQALDLVRRAVLAGDKESGS